MAATVSSSREVLWGDPLGVSQLGRVLINGHQSKRLRSVCFTPKSGREASPFKESALCHEQTSSTLATLFCCHRPSRGSTLGARAA
jgi:hypothetical protein